MKFQTKPNPWSCVGTAFAMVLDISVAEFFGHVGHDGSEIAFPMLPDPMARRGLHIQECIAACMKLSYAVTPIELFPVIQATTPGENDIIVIFGDDESANWHRFEHTIQTSTGVLEGVGCRCLHAVAYDHGTIFDPDGSQYAYSHHACESRRFYPRRAWRVDHLTSESQKDSSMTLPYDHGLTKKIIHSSDREQNEQLFRRIVTGDTQAREEMIEGNMPLVIIKVNSFIQRNPQLTHLRDDLHSAGFVGLVQAINRMADDVDSDIVNPNGYISTAITNEFIKLARKEAMHSGITLIDVTECDMLVDMNPTDDAPEVLHVVPESVVDVGQSATTELRELREVLESCCESNEERTLMRMREEGCSDREIAETLNIPRPSIQRLRKELEERFNQKSRELEEN